MVNIIYYISIYVLCYPHITPRDLRGWFAAATLILFYTLHVQSLSSSSPPPPTRFLGIRFPCNVFLRQSFCRPIPIGACGGGGDDGGVDSVGRPRRSLTIFSQQLQTRCVFVVYVYNIGMSMASMGVGRRSYLYI